MLTGLVLEGVSAQSKIAKYSPQSSESGVSYSVHIPSSTAQNGQGSIFIQMVAPKGTQWLGLGQGTQMSGANIMIMYSSGSDNVTVSPRLGKGEFEPQFNQEGQIRLLEGSGMSSDGVMTANIRCDSCLSWDGGSLSPTSGTSDWIWAIKRGNAIQSSDTSADLRQHDERGTFKFDLGAATSEDTANPFIGASATESSSSSEATSSSQEGSYGASEGSSGSESTSDMYRKAHGIIMAIVVLFLLPIGAAIMYLPFRQRVLFAHAPVQILGVLLLIAGAVLGILLGRKIDKIDKYHQIIGYIVVGSLILFQPILGLLQHLRFRRHGTKTVFGHVHRSLGRALILLGIINGGLGFYLSGPVGSEYSPKWAVIAYSVIAAIVGTAFVALSVWGEVFRKPTTGARRVEKEHDRNGRILGS